jgi:hypothetical protein
MMKKLMMTMLLSTMAFNVYSMCDGDETILTCVPGSGPHARIELCKRANGNYYVMELVSYSKALSKRQTYEGDTNKISLTAAQKKKWEQKGILEWDCHKKDESCNTITDGSEGLEFLITDRGIINDGGC